MFRWSAALLAALLGAIVGLAYGWVISPVQYVDTVPSALRADYRADFVLMIAERYDADHDVESARRHLSTLGAEDLRSVCSDAIRTARASTYAPQDLALLEQLGRAIEAIASVPRSESPRP
jgi:hypothetical protein